MRRYTRQITKDVYEKAMANRGMIPTEMELEVFGECLVWGYGVYDTNVRIDDELGYVVDYETGETCH
jgi:hypothetical protein